ncbi:hypothetical protein HK100_001581 [Physocladia obscura]|uniref:CBM1 domain-containing protein n=1 Tax=Physocladia obscura TaxID=109957 RepID=A0AAD5SYM1_9FUNG|nr:hypothetical protein HK100_001581 [Physocladia obscura]
MSMATHNLGYAVVGPVPNVCSFDSDFSVFQNTTTWTDVPIDWPLNNMSPGTQNFVWSIQWGPHFSDTFEFNFWITNADFVYTVGQNVTFADFESTQFCHQPYNASDTTANPNVVPNTTNSTFTVTCNVPARSGHHIIKAEWGRTAPTLERFHCCVDGLFGGTGTVVTTAAVSSTTTTTTTSTTTTTTTKSTTVIATTTNTTTSTATTKSSTTTVQTTIATSTSTGTASKACSAKYGQCGGLNWTGATCCVSSSCSVTNPYYSQCL